ncbi:protein kilB [Streptantibioticus silvisoli]|nr:protein kilB [Streptantibioticus silvisoli]
MDSIVAVAGTLLGSVVAYWLQQRASRAERAAAGAADVQREVTAAVAQLAAALADHRSAMWLREDLRLSGTEPDAYDRARAASHTTRAAITAPLATVKILAPHLARPAAEAAQAAYALRNAADTDTLNAARAAAITAADQLLTAAARP